MTATMAEVITPVQQTFTTAPESLKLVAETILPPPIQNIVTTHPTSATRNSSLNFNTMSPVNQKGHFEFDRVLKTGYVMKQRRKRKVIPIMQSGARY